METDSFKLKLAFAAELLRNNEDGIKAAFVVFSDDAGKALQLGRAWINDPVVIAEKQRLLNTTDAKTFLPSKEQQARDVYSMATDATKEIDDRLKAHRLYAEIMGHIEKPTSGGVNILAQGVMVVRDAGTDEEWAEKASRQQRTLTGDASIN